MKKFTAVILSVLLLGLCLCGFTSCGGNKEFPVTVQEIEIKEEPLNVVVLSKNLADVLTCIGYDGKLVGRSDQVNQQGIEVVPSVGSAQEPDVEKIKELNTDVVFADSTLQQDVKKKIQDEDIYVLTYDVVPTLSQLQTVYSEIGSVLGGNLTGKQAGVDGYNKLVETMKRIKETAYTGDQINMTFAYVYLDENGILKTLNEGKWATTLTNYTGALNVMENSESDEVDEETLELSNPDFLFCDSQETIDYLNQSLVLWDLPALSGATVVELDSLNLQGYTSLEVLENMVAVIYPDEDE